MKNIAIAFSNVTIVSRYRFISGMNPQKIIHVYVYVYMCARVSPVHFRYFILRLKRLKLYAKISRVCNYILIFSASCIYPFSDISPYKYLQIRSPNVFPRGKEQRNNSSVKVSQFLQFLRFSYFSSTRTHGRASPPFHRGKRQAIYRRLKGKEGTAKGQNGGTSESRDSGYLGSSGVGAIRLDKRV